MHCIKIFPVVLIILICYNISFCQDERIADSLKVLYHTRIEYASNLEILEEITFNETNPDSILKYSELLINQSLKADNLRMAHSGFLQKGNGARLKGDLDLALNAYFKSIDYALQINYQGGVGKVYISIADTYSENNNSANASAYYNKGIGILRELNDSLSLARALINAGDEYFNTGQLDSSIIYTKEAEYIFQKINSKIGQAYSLGNLGMNYAQQGDDLKAEQNMNKAIQLLEEVGEFNPVSVYLTFIADIYIDKGDASTALIYARRSLDLAHQYGYKDQVSDASLKISQIYEHLGDHIKSLSYYKDYITYRDSVKNIESVQQMANLRTDFEVSQKQTEVDLLNEQKRNQRITVIATAVALFLIILLAIGLYRRNQFARRTNKIIEEEKNRSDSLLLNILPEETAEELKKFGKVKARKFESVTVLFTDFKSFTKYAEKLSPEELVESVDYYFSKFDDIIEKYGLEKIKTIGDAYMCAGGLPFPSEDHALKMVHAAIEIAKFVETEKTQTSGNAIYFDIRLGINTGPVVSGVVGTKKFAYDIWGDTVNVASRMESNSEPGKINISESTYAMIKDEFSCEYRGELTVKNRGSMKMYFVNGKI